MSTDLAESWQRYAVLWDQFHHDRCIGDSRPNVNDFVFVVHKMYQTSSYIHQDLGSRPISVWVAATLEWEISDFFLTWVHGASAKTTVFPVSCAQRTGKNFTTCKALSRTLNGVGLRTKSHKNVRFRNFYIRFCHAEKRTAHSDAITVQLPANGEISPESCFYDIFVSNWRSTSIQPSGLNSVPLLPLNCFLLQILSEIFFKSCA